MNRILILIALVALAGCSKKAVKMDVLTEPKPVVIKPAGGLGIAGAVKTAGEKVETSTPIYRFTVFFLLNSAEISTEQTTMLDEIVRDYRGFKIAIEGHCCPIGTDEYNYTLGLARASMVAQWLRDRGANDVVTSSKGESEPISTEPARYWENRRAEIVITDHASDK